MKQKMKQKDILESQVQRSLIKKYEADGWFVVKLILTTKAGIPDLLLLKNGKARFVEVKRQNGHPTKLQLYRIQQLRDMGFDVQVKYHSEP